MRALAISLVLLAACGGDDAGPPVDAPPATGTADVSVSRYDYELDLETRAASTQVTMRALAAGNCIALPSRAAMLDLGSVRIGETTAVATWDGATLTACLPAGQDYAANAELVLSAVITQQPLERWGQSQVGYTVTPDGVSGNPQSYFYLISWVGGCDRFGPCDTRPGTFAHYRFTVHHRAGIRALCPGTVATTETTTTCDFTFDGGPTYSTFGFIAYGGWNEATLGSWDGVDVTLYERPGAAFPVSAAIDSADHTGFMDFMQRRFGPYPYGDELRIVVAPTYWSGFEHPGNIVLDSGLTRGTSSYVRPVHHVLNHEIAHQWAGDQATLADTYDFVWKEAMAEYLAFVYEDTLSASEALATARAWKSFAVGAAYHPVPEDRPELLSYYGEVYGPGPMILFRQLEGLTTREQVLDAIAMLISTERAVSVTDVQAALESTTGLDLDTYFDIWVRGSGAPVWPTFRATITGTAGAQTLTVTETTPGGVLHGCNFSVELRGASLPAETQRVAVVRGVDGMASVSVPVPVAWNVVATVIDPDAECLAFTDTATAVAPPRHAPGWTPWRGSLDTP